MKWTSRILILAMFIAAVVGCQKGHKAAATKEGRSGTSAKAASPSAKSSAKSGGRSGTSGSAKSGTTAKTASTGQKSGSANTVHPGTLTVADNGRSFDVKRGELIVVKLDSSHSSGFRWALAEDLGAVLKQEGSPGFVRNAAKTGKTASGGSETWRFRTVSLGRETVKLEYGRPWESIPDRAFRFTVTVR